MSLGSVSGHAYFISRPNPQRKPSGWQLEFLQGGIKVTKLNWTWNANHKLIRVPYRYLCFVVLILGAIPWVKSHYSIRTLLIALTILAMMLALVVTVKV